MLGILGTLVFRSAVAGFSYGVGGVWYIRNTLSYFGNKTLVLWEQMPKIARPEQRLNNDFANTRVCVTTLTQYLTDFMTKKERVLAWYFGNKYLVHQERPLVLWEQDFGTLGTNVQNSSPRTAAQ